MSSNLHSTAINLNIFYPIMGIDIISFTPIPIGILNWLASGIYGYYAIKCYIVLSMLPFYITPIINLVNLGWG